MPVDVAAIEDEIEAGFTEKVAGPCNERDRLQRAYDNLRFSQANFEEYPTRDPDDGDPAGGARGTDVPRRTSPVFQRVMEVLTANLYKSSPTRQLSDTFAQEWLAQVYKRNAMWAKWQRADQLTVVSDFAAFQFSGDTDPRAPVKIQLWGADSLVVWTDPDDATEVGAVGVIDAYDGRKRLRLYTQGEGAEIVFYRTKSKGDHPGSGGQAWYEYDRKDNPYVDANGIGTLPFSFVHFNFPTQDFYSGGIGDSLTQLNDHVNYRLDSLGEAIAYCNNPITIAEGVEDGWSPPARVKPGLWLTIPGEGLDAAGNPMGPPPNVRHLTPEHGYISSDWEDLNNYLDHELEMHGIPPATIRMVQSGARSGVSIIAEQAPLLAWVEKRRGPFTAYEENALVKALQVGAAWLRINKMANDARRLDELAIDPQLTLKWPKLYTQLPGPDRDTADDWRVSRAYATKIQVFMEREGCTEQEAIDHFQKVTEQNELLTSMGIDPGIPQPMAPSAGADGDNGESGNGAETSNENPEQQGEE